MPGPSSIEWTERTWNPATGCDEVSPGCAHCYAKVFAERWRGVPGHAYEQGFDIRLWPERLQIPLRRQKPTMWFVNSMSDLFHDEIPATFIAKVFAVMMMTPRHTYQVLTKRPERMHALLTGGSFPLLLDAALGELGGERLPIFEEWAIPVLPNVWLGVTIENRRFVGRADLLRQTPAAVRFISAEPLLGPLIDAGPGFSDLDLTLIDWLIVGGESGPGHRRIDPDWARDLRDACQSHGLVCCGMRSETGRCCEQPDREDGRPAFFFKQWGGFRAKAGGRELDGRTWDEMPAGARVPA